MIHHGVPDIPYGGTEKFRDGFGNKGRTVISTINLISRNKGLEYAIKAIAQLSKKYPQLLYQIIGRTHPVVARLEDDSYRHELEELVRKHKLEENVRFINRYVPLDELVEHLRSSDMYITPYLDPQQITSGALAYAVGAGKACISTPYIYAKEVLAEGKGQLVKFKDSASIAESVEYLLNHSKEKKEMEQKAYAYGRHMTWANVSLKHLNLYWLVSQESRKEELITA